MKVLINAFDSATESGPFPNLACMKIAAYHKARGDEVAMVGKGLTRQDSMPDPDIVYCSCIFDWNGAQARGTKWMHGNAEFRLGGSGVDLTTTLPPEIEAMPPDYAIYDDRGVPGWPFVVGFSTRGCNRKCPFCIVPQKEGRVVAAVDMERLISSAPEAAQGRLLLLDNNIVQSATVREDLRWLADWGGEVNYSQGIDARVIVQEPDLAGLLCDTKYRSRTFKSKLMTSAYDWPQMSNTITKCVEIFKEVGMDVRHCLQFYVLVNYNTTMEKDLERIYHLRELGTNPYVMIYDKRNSPHAIRKMARWANAWPIFHSVDWADYEAKIKKKG